MNAARLFLTRWWPSERRTSFSSSNVLSLAWLRSSSLLTAVRLIFVASILPLLSISSSSARFCASNIADGCTDHRILMCPLRADTLKPFIEQGTVTFAEPEIAGTLLPATQDSQEMPVPALETSGAIYFLNRSLIRSRRPTPRRAEIVRLASLVTV